MKIQRFILLINLIVSQCFYSQNTVQNAINSFASSPELRNATVTFLAVDMESGIEIASFNPLTSVPTASTTKLFATASAIEILGTNYRPETRIYMDGVINKEGTLIGNIWIRGGGDVTLGSKYFNESGHEKDFLKIWGDSIKRWGIKSIAGAIIADGSEFGYEGVPDGWSWNDMGNYYGAGPSGICIFDNMLRLNFKTGSKAGSKTELISTFPTVPNLVFHNYITSENVQGDNSYIFGGPYSLDRFATGSLPVNQSSFEVKGSIPDPEHQLAHELTLYLNSIGIKVSEDAKSVRQLDIQKKDRYMGSYTLLFSHKGQTILDIATLTNMKSINLFAEGLVCLIGYKLSGIGTTEEGLDQIDKYWSKRISTSGLFLKDGSGLSRSNGISASHFCDLLKTMLTSKNYPSFYATLPIAGKSGTLASFCKDQPAQGRIAAKSGTMSRIKSYSGYVNSKSGKKIAFSISVSNFICSSSAVTGKIEKVLNNLAVY